jgi:hypothetical protein
VYGGCIIVILAAMVDTLGTRKEAVVMKTATW